MRILKFYTAFFIFFASLIAASCFIISSEDNTGAVFFTSVQKSGSRIIIIDPGHGGQDGGATGVDGVNEKDINLEMSLCLRDIFLLSGREVILTRTSDDDTDGKEGFDKHADIHRRADAASEFPDGIFLGVHMNASSSSRDQGFTAFYGKKHQASRFIADSISAAVRQSNLSTRVRDVKMSPDTVYIFKTIQNPAVLIEFGFVTNPEDCALLQSADYRTAFAVTVWSGVSLFE